MGPRVRGSSSIARPPPTRGGNPARNPNPIPHVPCVSCTRSPGAVPNPCRPACRPGLSRLSPSPSTISAFPAPPPQVRSSPSNSKWAWSRRAWRACAGNSVGLGLIVWCACEGGRGQGFGYYGNARMWLLSRAGEIQGSLGCWRRCQETWGSPQRDHSARRRSGRKAWLGFALWQCRKRRLEEMCSEGSGVKKTMPRPSGTGEWGDAGVRGRDTRQWCEHVPQNREWDRIFQSFPKPSLVP